MSSFSVSSPTCSLPSFLSNRLRLWQCEPALLYDVRVNPDRRMRTDDAVYERDEEVRERVARGNCFLQLAADTANEYHECAVQALRKFTGGLGDDDDITDQDDMADDEDVAWKRFFLKPIEQAARFVSMEKVRWLRVNRSINK